MSLPSSTVTLNHIERNTLDKYNSIKPILGRLERECIETAKKIIQLQYKTDRISLKMNYHEVPKGLPATPPKFLHKGNKQIEADNELLDTWILYINQQTTIIKKHLLASKEELCIKLEELKVKLRAECDLIILKSYPQINPQETEAIFEKFYNDGIYKVSRIQVHYDMKMNKLLSFLTKKATATEMEFQDKEEQEKQKSEFFTPKNMTRSRKSYGFSNPKGMQGYGRQRKQTRQTHQRPHMTIRTNHSTRKQEEAFHQSQRKNATNWKGRKDLAKKRWNQNTKFTTYPRYQSQKKYQQYYTKTPNTFRHKLHRQ